MNYNERTYRSRFRGDRWTGFVVKHRESDLWIGVDKASFREEMVGFCADMLAGLRAPVEDYLAVDPEYGTSLEPYEPCAEAPEMILRMAEAASKAGVGPMAAVAGAVAEAVGQALRSCFDIGELIIENGGDIYADIAEGIDVAVFAGESPLSDKVGLRVPAGTWGVCTSSGTVGHSLSLGSADAVMVVCRDAMLSDAWATALANRVQTVADVERVAQEIGGVPDIAGALLVKDDRMAVAGVLEMKIFA